MKFYKIAPPLPLKDHFILAEAGMSIGELVKYKEADNTDQFKRVNVLIQKIESGAPIELVDGTAPVFPAEMNQEVLDALRTHDTQTMSLALKGAVLIDADGNKHRLSEIQKSADFGGAGGGGGAKSGAKQTEEQEIGQAVVCGLVAVTPTATAQDLVSDKMLMKGAKRTVPSQEAASKIPNIIALLQSDPAWAETFIQTAALLDEHIGLRGKMFHRGGPLVEKINAAFATVNANTKPKPFTNINKWNPADIWIATAGFAEDPPTDDFKTLNRWIFDQYNAGQLVGVSLKKASKNPHIEVVNGNPGEQRLRILLDELIVAKSATGLEQILKSGDTYMTFKKESAQLPLSWYYMITEAGKNEVQYRAFNKGGSIQGEIGGTEARHGKIGFGNIDAVLFQLTGHHLTTMVAAKRMERPQLLEGIVKMAAQVMGVRASAAVKQAVDKNSRGRDISVLHAKYQAVELVWRVWQFRQKNPKEADLFIERLLEYASSSTPLSSLFLKVS